MPIQLPLVALPLIGLPLLALVGIHMALDESQLAIARLAGLCLAPPVLLLTHVLVIFLWPATTFCK